MNFELINYIQDLLKNYKAGQDQAKLFSKPHGSRTRPASGPAAAVRARVGFPYTSPLGILLNIDNVQFYLYYVIFDSFSNLDR